MCGLTTSVTNRQPPSTSQSTIGMYRAKRRRVITEEDEEEDEEEEEEPALKSSILNLYSNTCFDSENQIGPTSKSNIKGRVHYGSKQGNFETLNYTLFHELRSERSERARE